MLSFLLAYNIVFFPGERVNADENRVNPGGKVDESKSSGEHWWGTFFSRSKFDVLQSTYKNIQLNYHKVQKCIASSRTLETEIR